MRVRFWGVRGSAPWAAADAIRYGCNTPCIEVTGDGGERLVLDAGTGLIGLGREVAGVAADVAILLTHYHWDHIQGLPYFPPVFDPSARIAVWGPQLGAAGAAAVRAVFESPFFPIPLARAGSRPAIHTITGRRLRIGAFDIAAQPLHHPGGAFAYRIFGPRGDLVYATDHEIGDASIDAPLGEFARGAAAIVMGGHFTPEELPAHQGWGHSSWKQCAEFAAAHDARRLWLFHHKPGRTDAEVDRITDAARIVFPAAETAREGVAFEI